MENDNNKNIFTFDPGEPPEKIELEEIFPEGTDEFLPEYDPEYDPEGIAEGPEDADYEPADDPDDEDRVSILDRVKGVFSSIKFKKPELDLHLPKISLPKKKEPDAPRKKMSKKTVFLIRRIVAALILLVLFMIPIVNFIRGGRGSKKIVTSKNVGPLPSEEVVVHKVPVYYDYTKPVPETDENTAHFTDAIIAGDTRLIQLLSTYGIGTFGTEIYGSAINVSNALSYDSVDGDGAARTLGDALASGTYGKVYLCLGINELGWSYPDVFESDYRDLLTEIKRMQPAASVYLLALVPVNENDYDSDYVNNTRIKEYNEMIRRIAADNKFYYVDCYTGMADASGNLNSAYTSNGFYITEDGAKAWWAYLATHTVNPEEFAN